MKVEDRMCGVGFMGWAWAIIVKGMLGRVMRGVASGLMCVVLMAAAAAQAQAAGQGADGRGAPEGAQAAAVTQVTLTVRSTSGLAVQNAEVTVEETGRTPVNVWTDYAGRCTYVVDSSHPYRLRIEATGYYTLDRTIEHAGQTSVVATLAHEELLEQQVKVSASPEGLDTQQPADKATMSTAAIVNIPYVDNRDIRNLLPYFPGVVADGSGQVHVAGSETWETLDTLDGFDIRSPVSGVLALRISTDAVRSIYAESTRYPVQYGRATGGVIALETGTGGNKFRFNATNFLPSYHDLNGIRFDKIEPRFTFSGPLVRNKAWFFDGIEGVYSDVYIPELPAGARNNHPARGSNFLKLNVDTTSSNNVTAAVLFNDYHSPYEGLSPLTPQQSTTKHDTISWMPYMRDQQRLPNGGMVEAGFGVVRIRDGYEPHGTLPFELTPETSKGSYFENLTGFSQRQEGNATLFLPRQHWHGNHDVRMGIDVDHINFSQRETRAPVRYLREDGTLLRESTFPQIAPFTRHNVEVGGYVEDHWQLSGVRGLMLDPGVRLDWDEIVRRPLFSPRIALVYAPGTDPKTKIAAGVGIYYEHTQLAYLEEALAGIRNDTYYESNGVTPASPPEQTTFTYHEGSLHEARAVNWSVSVAQQLPGKFFAELDFLDKRTNNVFTYVNQNGPQALYGDYLLTNGRTDHDYEAEIQARKTFAHGYTLFAAYTWSYAHTNAAIEYSPTISLLGPQQSGPLPWDTPNRVISWGWLPFEVPWFKKNWDFVYSLQWQNGFPITSVNANNEVVGKVGSHRFPNFVSFNPGLEWRFHLGGFYFGLRGIIVNATNSQNPAVVNSDVDSRNYLQFTEPYGRALTARIRLIEWKH